MGELLPPPPDEVTRSYEDVWDDLGPVRVTLWVRTKEVIGFWARIPQDDGHVYWTELPPTPPLEGSGWTC